MRSRSSRARSGRPSGPGTRHGPPSWPPTAAGSARRSGQPQREVEALCLESVRSGLLYLPNIPADERTDRRRPGEDNVEVRRWWPGLRAQAGLEPGSGSITSGCRTGRSARPCRSSTWAPARTPGRLHVPALSRQQGPVLLRLDAAFAHRPPPAGLRGDPSAHRRVDRDHDLDRPPAQVRRSARTTSEAATTLWLIPHRRGAAHLHAPGRDPGGSAAAAALPPPRPRATAAEPRSRPKATPAACCACTSSTRWSSSPTPRPTSRPRGAQADILAGPGRCSRSSTLPYRNCSTCARATSAGRRPAPSISRPAARRRSAGSRCPRSSWLRLPGPAGQRALPAVRRGARSNWCTRSTGPRRWPWPRIWAALMENGRQEDGTVLLPEALAPYVGGELLIKAP